MAATRPAVRVRIKIPISHVGIAGANPRSRAARVSSEPSVAYRTTLLGLTPRHGVTAWGGMADSSDEIPLWLMVGAALLFPFLFVFGALILGASKLGHWAGNRLRAIGRGGQA